jgi:AbrB family looped-hinge helix DNA binding protein
MPDKMADSKADDCFCGTATIGERGQVVIPADLRKEMGLHAGAKVLLWKHPSGKGLMLFPVDSVREFMNMMLATLERAEGQGGEPPQPNEGQ